MGEPYVDHFGYVYTSLSKYVNLSNGLEGVFAIDLNTSWRIFNETLADHDEIIHHSFFISP